jgi:hypothetical protein
VRRVLATPPLPAELTDAILDSTDEELAASAAQLADDTREWLERVGALKPTRSILDLGHDQLVVISAVYGMVMSWWAQPGRRDRPLGQLLKVVRPTWPRRSCGCSAWPGFSPRDRPNPRSRDRRASTSARLAFLGLSGPGARCSAWPLVWGAGSCTCGSPVPLHCRG